MNKESSPTLACSFCGKSSNEVAHLIAGPHVNICNSCIYICHEALKSKISYTPLQDVQEVLLPDSPIQVGEVIAKLAKYHFETQVHIKVTSQN